MIYIGTILPKTDAKTRRTTINMWQRKQTIYLLLITTLLVFVQILPVLHFNDPIVMSATATGMQGMPREVYPAFIYNPNTGEYVFGWMTSLAVISIAVALLAFLTIFDYKNRRRQMRGCRLGQLLLLLWCVVCGVVAYVEKQGGVTPQFGICLPIVSIVLYWLAYKGVKHDDELVRSADRLR